LYSTGFIPCQGVSLRVDKVGNSWDNYFPATGLRIAPRSRALKALSQATTSAPRNGNKAPKNGHVAGGVAQRTVENMTRISSAQVRLIVTRALRTGLQAAVAVVLATQADILSVSAWRAAGVAAISAIVAALMNAVEQTLQKAETAVVADLAQNFPAPDGLTGPAALEADRQAWTEAHPHD
jgi:hypothetical protein